MVRVEYGTVVRVRDHTFSLDHLLSSEPSVKVCQTHIALVSFLQQQKC